MTERVISFENRIRSDAYVKRYNKALIDEMRKGILTLDDSTPLEILRYDCNEFDEKWWTRLGPADFYIRAKFLAPNQPIDKRSWSKHNHHLYGKKIRDFVKVVFMSFFKPYGRDLCELIAKQVVESEFHLHQIIDPLPKVLSNLLNIENEIMLIVRNFTLQVFLFLKLVLVERQLQKPPRTKGKIF